MTIHRIRILVLCGLCVFCGRDALAQQYTITDLGTLGGTFSTASAINASGQVVGRSRIDPSFTTHAFLWSDGVMQDLGVLTGREWSWALAINDSGQVVGYSGDRAVDQAFLWTVDAGMTALPVPSGFARAFGINARGHIVGVRGDTPYEGFLYQDGVISGLGAYVAYGINDHDQIVGEGPHGARLWDASGTRDLDDEGGFSAAYVISPKGVIAGSSTRGAPLGGSVHAVLWTPYGLSDLGTLPGGDQARALAMSGNLVVGGSATAPFGSAWHAFFYDTSGPGYALDLNGLIPSDSGWVLREATGINAVGQIVGDGTVNGETHAFLLTPMQARTTSR